MPFTFNEDGTFATVPDGDTGRRIPTQANLDALGEGGGGGVTVDNTVDAPAAVSTIVAPGAVIVGDEATFGYFIVSATDPGAVGAGAVWKDISVGPGTQAVWRERDGLNTTWDAIFFPRVVATGGDQANMQMLAESVDGFATANANATASGDGGANAKSSATAEGAGEADASPTASAADGDAYASPYAVTTGSGSAYAGPYAEAQGAGDGDATSTALAASGTATNGFTATGTAGTVSLIATVDALTGGLVATGLPTADPVVAGGLWIDTAAGRVLKVSAG